MQITKNQNRQERRTTFYGKVPKRPHVVPNNAIESFVKERCFASDSFVYIC